MNTHDHHLDDLIGAHLDGRLSDAQRAELFRQLLRDPEARQRMDRAAAIDQLTTEALRDAIEAPHPPRSAHKPHTAWRRATALAAAAMILLALGLWATVRPFGVDRPAPETAAAPIADIEPAPVETAAAVEVELAVETEAPQPVVMAIADEGPPWWRANPGEPAPAEQVVAPVKQNPKPASLGAPRKGRAVIGVLDETTDRFYWLQIEREQSVIESVVGEL